METRSSGVRPMFALVLLLVWVSPPSCRASWMWLGATSGPGAAELGDAALSGRQRAVCRAAPLLARGVRDGARLAVAECQNRFRLERWNCSTTRNPAAPFGHEMTSEEVMSQCLSRRNQGDGVHAVMAAGLVHSVTRACSQGNMTECGDARLRGARLRGGGGAAAAQGWQWGGCSDNGFGTWFSRRFMDVSEKNSSTGRDGFTLSTMNRHNAEAGRQAIQVTMSTDCRCHGISGSCAVKTCWRSVAPFQRVGAYLKERYERSVQVSDRARRKTRKKDQRHPVDINELIYLNKSPNYCLEDRRRGIAGTRGRRCNRTSAGPDGCNLLCCGRGYNTHVVRNIQRCECKFVWCCYVHCRRCESMNDMHTCK
ncbi:LOW QUALITY PROTEIN: protein Wnt-16 [Poeciliopsis prolifica]|uniref:LOW QUALITY PROTEIN: protein Wnt-16 n=1 Tax=Poeciliopsis prolifica TaxID=188132 RepID=UPI0024144835|nr:LOW QUALITY PROTEIN: protein Wnt-16 [Poeciliopsis prolifica]